MSELDLAKIKERAEKKYRDPPWDSLGFECGVDVFNLLAEVERLDAKQKMWERRLDERESQLKAIHHELIGLDAENDSLLEAAKALSDDVDYCCEGVLAKELKQLRAAIAKAEGGEK